jgi:flagellar biosynthesis protein FlhB
MPKKSEHKIVTEGITVAGALLGIVIWLHVAGALVLGSPFSKSLFTESLILAVAASLIFLFFTLFFNSGFSALNTARRDSENPHILVRKAAVDISLHAMAYTNGVAFSFLLTTILHILAINFTINEPWLASTLNTIIFSIVYLAARDFNLKQIIQHPLRTIFALVCAAIVFRFTLFNIWDLQP